MKIPIRKCGDKMSIALPDDALAQLGWERGDNLSAEITADGLVLTRTMTAHDHAMKIAREAMDKYRETLEALAKS